MTFRGNDRVIMIFLTDLRNCFIEDCFTAREQEKSRGKFGPEVKHQRQPKMISKPIYSSMTYKSVYDEEKEKSF